SWRAPSRSTWTIPRRTREGANCATESPLFRDGHGRSSHGDRPACRDPLEVVEEDGRIELAVPRVPDREANGDDRARLGRRLRLKPARRSVRSHRALPHVEPGPREVAHAERAIGA